MLIEPFQKTGYHDDKAEKHMTTFGQPPIDDARCLDRSAEPGGPQKRALIGDGGEGEGGRERRKNPISLSEGKKGEGERD